MDYPIKKPGKKKPTFNDLVLWAEELDRFGYKSWFECLQAIQRYTKRGDLLPLVEGFAYPLATQTTDTHPS